MMVVTHHDCSWLWWVTKNKQEQPRTQQEHEKVLQCNDFLNSVLGVLAVLGDFHFFII